jgi:tetratricopeptide (TPR) repeat protein
MSHQFGKDVIICHSSKDRPVADELAHILKDLFGEQVWLRHFDLSGGQILTNAISRTIEDARWFILLLSTSSLESPWVQAEAQLATFQAIENEHFKIITLQLESLAVPSGLKQAIAAGELWDLTGKSDREADFIQLAQHIQGSTSPQVANDVYVGRGDASDRFAMIARRNKVIFLLGWPGIGKTAFCTYSIPSVLKRSAISISLTRGHSGDLLARQLLQRTHVRQPTGIHSVSEAELLAAAVDAVAARSEHFFLFLDDVEDALDPNNKPHPYLENVLKRLVNAIPDIWIVLATTRLPDYSASLGSHADVLRLEPLKNDYVFEAIDLWLKGTPQHTELLHSTDLDALVELAAGHPLAAKLIASQLAAGKAIDELLTAKQKNRFELKLAEYILRATESELSDAEKLLLQILSIVGEPVAMGDVLQLPVAKQLGPTSLQEARSSLSNRFLIQQKSELISLHKFLGTFFRDELLPQKKYWHRIANEYAEYAYARTIELNMTLMLQLREKDRSDAEVVELSNDVFRYAIPAARLLRLLGKDDLAERLPIQVKGTIREMVFHFYQEEHNYREALRYAEQWLQMYPDDLEIQLYQARCYRNERDPKNLQKAIQILKRLEEKDQQQYMQVRVLRERGMISQQQGDLNAAKEYFRRGIARAQKGAFYIDNHVGLAAALLQEFERESTSGLETGKAMEALGLLESARQISATFDRFHLGSYVEALIVNGKDEMAMPLLDEALLETPNDPTLNYRHAEILKRRGSLKEAERAARVAMQNGSSRALLTLVNILFSQAIQLLDKHLNRDAEDLFKRAISILDNFRPEYGSDKEVAVAIRAKILRMLGDWSSVRAAVSDYEDTENTFIVYEQCLADLHFAEREEEQSRWSNSLTETRKVLSRLNKFAVIRPLSAQLDELRIAAEAKERRLLEQVK